MCVILLAGLHAVTQRIPLEVFPSFELDIININVPFRGATPEDAEEAVVTRIEEAIFDLDIRLASGGVYSNYDPVDLLPYEIVALKIYLYQ